ncbi:ABC_ATPase domain containing protein [uncultured Caudovirales phage]|uniref:ABC_ATPase domain containing protein n=1 Tax=uncultured Caudovirales phage TaxID=2100421 RepID=A0A6J5S6I7_9CAUD|nr:ABC_ATPase domain containing protein [uncultured Caudovirales phage]CAB4152230.1 ABC_ATPase domain containing protein [uncultured Caudovirales phage]CAB4173040.1 ABC_ATPase domain containing protein [uncultured Caudovirales phage]CAB4184632.1 ABC_ATPase domain containing protein [uncultured Caudovirales phage]CAB4204140.1 ABC_ATPase domain containing protein [uncultured Caudovirales phage]
MFPKVIDIKLESELFSDFRCQVAANSLDIDVKKKSIHHLHIDNVNIPKDWNIGLIYGASGSGKTTLVKKLFGDDIFNTVMDENTPIINQLPSHMSYDECSSMLYGIGLNAVPCWIRPIKTLSNGQKARAEAVLLMCQDKDIIFIDEWTSVVDRTVAKAMSVCLYKFAKKYNKKIVLLSCHYDILEWVNPDWLIDCNKQQFELPKGDDFFFSRREELDFTIRKVDKRTWKYFSKYHYLSENLPAGHIFFYGLFHKENQIGFQCYANYTPHKKGTKIIFHFNRTVVHPDYNGLGLGVKMINETARLMIKEHNCRIMGKFSSIPVYKALLKDPNWKFVSEKRVMGYLNAGNKIQTYRKKGFREKGVKTYTFEFIDKKNI